MTDLGNYANHDEEALAALARTTDILVDTQPHYRDEV